MSAFVLVTFLLVQLQDETDPSVGAAPQSTEQGRGDRTERSQEAGMSEASGDLPTEVKGTPSEEGIETAEVPLMWWVEGAGPLAPSALSDCLQRLGAALRVLVI